MGKTRTVVPVLVPKDSSWQDKVLDYCVDSFERGSIPNPEVKSQPKTLLALSAKFWSTF